MEILHKLKYIHIIYDIHIKLFKNLYCYYFFQQLFAGHLHGQDPRREKAFSGTH